MRADIRVQAERSAGIGVGLRVGIDMHPVGMEPRGKLGILIDQAGHAVALHELHKGRGAGLIDRRIVSAQEDASHVRRGQCRSELGLERDARACRKLEIEPGPGLRFSRNHLGPPLLAC